ncbi:MAG: uncharacterized protein QOG70_503 [Solirubrobacteraceae bacterium]|jgi:uncharacterized OB-fold protein|nr:uncharacterized protein [Solirubrobacteraceae bacterium]
MTAHASQPEWSRPFFEGLDRHTLLLPRCEDCGEFFFPPRPFCPGCWSDAVQWVASEGAAEIYTFCVVRAYAPSKHEPRVPFVIAIVRLDEGVQMLCNVGSDGGESSGDGLQIGDRVAVRLGGSPAWPLVFEPTGSQP